MRYSLVFATIAASAIATPYINVEVSEPGDVVTKSNRHNHRDHGLKRHHRDGRNDRDDREGHRGWFSSLWGKNRDDDENDRRGRHGRRGHRHGRDNERDNDDEDEDPEFHPSNLMDDLFGSDYECVIDATSKQKEKRDARECCREVGGELYDVAGRCVFRDVYENPREEWRTCAMEQDGAVFADCYYREQREVDDELSSRRRHSQSRNRRHRDDRGSGRDNDRDDDDRKNSRKGRNGRKDHNGRGRYDDDHQIFLGRNDQDDNDRNRHGRNEIECRLNLNDENREKEITRECCRQRNVDGKLTENDQRCELRRDDNADEFEDCAEEQGVQENQIQCYRIDRQREF